MLQDLDLIYRGLQALPAFSKLRDSALSGLCAMVRYQRSDANDILYWSVPFIRYIYYLLFRYIYVQRFVFPFSHLSFNGWLIALSAKP